MDARRVWYRAKVDLVSADTIHQILMFGTLEEIQSLKRQVGEKKIKELFLQHPKKIYTAVAFNFIKNFILHILTPVDEQKYLKFTLRNIR